MAARRALAAPLAGAAVAVSLCLLLVPPPMPAHAADAAGAADTAARDEGSSAGADEAHGNDPARGADAADASQRFERANAAFAARHYAEARAGFAEILARDGASAPVLYNLGNASFRAGLLGDAVLAYERALLLAPRDQDIRANLRQARKAANLPPPEDAAWTRFVRLLTTDAWAWLASAGLYLLCASLLALRLLREEPRRATSRRMLRLVVAGTATLLLVAGGALAARLRETDRAVVLEGDPVLRVAPYASATAASELIPGDVVRIERTHQGFALVRTREGKSGWVSDRSVARIDQPGP